MSKKGKQTVSKILTSDELPSSTWNIHNYNVHQLNQI